uniref:Reverse transcriptase zinc-binding domain-containing protein n=1 Tax=Lactuca sativa TaxID=4236 RepID=A0A9R1X683_LACSA|nr:hypothetical protein LSAT_V11C600327530 [Lactuca sativa]
MGYNDGMNFGSSHSACIGSPENTDHVLMECPYATVKRNNILSWCGVPCDLPLFNNVGAFLHLAATWCITQKKKERFVVICYCLLWNLWRFRNKRLFHTEGISPLHGSESTKLMAFYWLKHRGKKGICSWEEWLVSPFSGL